MSQLQYHKTASIRIWVDVPERRMRSVLDDERNSCTRCNLRQHQDAWRCRTEGCPFEHKLHTEAISASSVTGDTIGPEWGHQTKSFVEASKTRWYINTRAKGSGNVVRNWLSEIPVTVYADQQLNILSN